LEPVFKIALLTIASFGLSFTMIATNIFLVSLQAILPFAVAQTPQGFNPPVTQYLEVAYGLNKISPAGKNIPRPGKYQRFCCMDQSDLS
jgi:hypothetical protein